MPLPTVTYNGRAHALRGAPAALGKRCGVHVGVEGDRNSERSPQWRDQLDVTSTRLGCTCDRAVGCRARIQIDGTEARDAEGG